MKNNSQVFYKYKDMNRYISDICYLRMWYRIRKEKDDALRNISILIPNTIENEFIEIMFNELYQMFGNMTLSEEKEGTLKFISGDHGPMEYLHKKPDVSKDLKYREINIDFNKILESDYNSTKSILITKFITTSIRYLTENCSQFCELLRRASKKLNEENDDLIKLLAEEHFLYERFDGKDYNYWINYNHTLVSLHQNCTTKVTFNKHTSFNNITTDSIHKFMIM